MKWFGFILLFICLVACTGQDTSTTRNRENDEWDIRETVFRYQFEHTISGEQHNTDYNFLALTNAQDPPQEFMARFANDKPNIEPLSASTYTTFGGVTHKSAGGNGIILRVNEIRWLEDNIVEVNGGYFRSGLSASSNVYKVEYLGNQWVVTEDTILWIE